MKLFYEILLVIKDFFFPQFCAGCGRYGQLVCEVCIKKLPDLPVQLCAGCGRESFSGRTCDACKSVDFPLDGLIFSDIYNDSALVSKLLRAFKYDNCLDLADVLVKRMEACLKSYFKFKSAVVLPIPLSPKSFRKRGYNQSDVLCRKINLRRGYIYRSDFLHRQNRPASQVSSGREKRLEIIKDCFYLQFARASPQITEQNFILVDDVYTTGATMCEAAMTIRKSFSCARVFGLVLARRL